MPRIRRIAMEGVPYHITQRGNGRQQVFFSDSDYEMYLDLLARYAKQERLRVHAYCLMPNHTHLIATPERPDSMPGTLSRTHADFARHFNLQRRSSGHVWQARYFSCPLDRMHFWQAVIYVERNPVSVRGLWSVLKTSAGQPRAGVSAKRPCLAFLILRTGRRHSRPGIAQTC